MGTSHGSRRDAGKHPGAGPPSETGEAPGFIQGGPFHLPATASVELIAPAPVGAPPSGEGWREGGAIGGAELLPHGLISGTIRVRLVQGLAGPWSKTQAVMQKQRRPSPGL